MKGLHVYIDYIHYHKWGRNRRNSSSATLTPIRTADRSSRLSRLPSVFSRGAEFCTLGSQLTWCTGSLCVRGILYFLAELECHFFGGGSFSYCKGHSSIRQSQTNLYSIIQGGQSREPLLPAHLGLTVESVISICPLLSEN